jgi:hypothetical protein
MLVSFQCANINKRFEPVTKVVYFSRDSLEQKSSIAPDHVHSPPLASNLGDSR